MHNTIGHVNGGVNTKSNGNSVRCRRDESGQTPFILNLETNTNEAGTVTGAGQYEVGDQISITAEANPGFEFINWTDDDGIVSEAADFSYTMPAEDITLTANFIEKQVGFNCGDPLIDTRDGQSYETVQIGAQCWMAENLAYLPEVFPSTQGSETDPYYYVYDYQGTDVNAAKASANYQNYGALYNWPASLTACPDGWHLPSDAEWTQLTDYVVGEGYPNNISDPDGVGNTLKSCRQVNSPLGGDCNTDDHPRWNSNSTHHGFDEFGFSSPPGGERKTSNFYNLGIKGTWWSSSEHSTSNAWVRSLRYENSEVGHNFYYGVKIYGVSVRCLKD
jgi:uncharacterized protein (TIGR02145 family)/uncharacterized repeat protein (TIGR02543 family)